MIKEILKEHVLTALKELDVEIDQVHFEHPSDFKNGDYATNVAMVYGKETGENPKELAEKIVQIIEKNIPEEIEDVVVAGPGFINFHLSSNFFADSIEEIIKKDDKWGKNDLAAGFKVMVEYTDPNPFKEFHIGHLMSNAIGESISRLISFSGAEVKRANYYGDVGLHVAKAIWGKIEKPDLSWGEAYTYGSGQYDDNKQVIDEINKKIYEKNDPDINELYDKGMVQSLAHFEEIYKKLDTKFDFDFPESDTWERGEKIVKENKEVFKESEGAVVFHGEEYGLHTRVFITREGLPTYETKDLGLLKLKSEKWDFNESISVTASEQSEYFKVIKKTMELVLPELASKVKHVAHGMMRLSTGKMSSRTGNIITGESLIADVEALAKEKTSDSDVALKVAIGAIKYSILKQAAGKDIIFDFEKSLSFEGASGPYLQYAHTRAQSVLEKAGEEPDGTKPPEDWSTTELERLLYRFPEIVERAQKEYEPHYMTTYLTSIAAAFGNFYATQRILDADEKERDFKLALVRAFQITMKNGLWLLGIQTPAKM